MLDDNLKRGFVQTTEWGMDLQIASVIANAELASGTALNIVMPIISVTSRRAAGFDDPVVGQDDIGTDLTESTDTGIGDIELRIRQELTTPLGLSGKYIPRVTVSAGFVTPTGHFILKEAGGLASTDTSRYVSIGRGVWWALFDIDVFGGIAERVGYMVQFASRYPFGTLQRENDEYAFAWGPEARVTAGLTGVIAPGLVNASLAMEMQWRDRGLEQFTKADGFKPFENGGMTMWTVTPTVQLILPKGFSLSANLRLPIAWEIYGTQPINGTALFGALNYTWAAAAPLSKGTAVSGKKSGNKLIQKHIVPGKITIIDYWATWCVPCKKLAPKLEAFAASRPDVVLKKVDLTELETQRAYLPGVPGLPVVDIYDESGALVERIIGPDCFKFANKVPAPKK